MMVWLSDTTTLENKSQNNVYPYLVLGMLLVLNESARRPKYLRACHTKPFICKGKRGTRDTGQSRAVTLTFITFLRFKTRKRAEHKTQTHTYAHTARGRMVQTREINKSTPMLRQQTNNPSPDILASPLASGGEGRGGATCRSRRPQ